MVLLDFIPIKIVNCIFKDSDMEKFAFRAMTASADHRITSRLLVDLKPKG